MTHRANQNHLENQDPLHLLQQAQKEISDRVGEFLYHDDIEIDILMDYLYVVKKDWLEQTNKKMSSDIGDKNLVSIDKALLGYANIQNNLGISEDRLSFGLLRNKLKAIRSMREEDLKDVVKPISDGGDTDKVYDDSDMEHISGIIMPPDIDIRPTVGSGVGGGEQKNKIKIRDKLSLVRDIISTHPDIIQIGKTKIGDVDKYSMRDMSYVVLYLATPYPKTIYINNLYGQATYIAEGHLMIEELITYHKSDYKSTGHPKIDFITYKDPSKLDLGDMQQINKWKKQIVYFLTKPPREDIVIDDRYEDNQDNKVQHYTDIITPSQLKTSITQTYGDGDEEKAIDFLIKQGANWRRNNFKIININNKHLGIKAISSIFNVKREISNYLFKDDARYELLAEIFGSDNEKLQEFKNNLDNPITRPQLKTSIVEKYGNGDSETALNLLIKQGTVWKQKHFKVNINNKDLGVTAISSIFNIKGKNREDIIKDDARYELLAEIFGSDNEKLQAFKKNLDNPITPSKLKTSITQTYGNGDKDKALDFLVKQGVEWKQKHFKVNINDKDLGIKSISSIFDIKRDNHNNLYKDDARYELLAKIFDKTIEDIQKLVDKKSKYN